jgi:hypothetical protein
MSDLRSIQNTFKALSKRKDIEMPGFLGNLGGVVQADNFQNVYVTLWNGEVVTVNNQRVPNIRRLPVIVGYDATNPNMRQVLRSREAFPDKHFKDIALHAKTHEWGELDTLWIRAQQFLPGLIVPNDDLSVHYTGGWYFLNGWHVLPAQDIDLSANVPDSGAIFVLPEVDEDGVITLAEGSAADSRSVLTNTNIPSQSDNKKSLKYAIKLYEGQTTVLETKTDSDLVDLRWGGADPADWNEIFNMPDWIGKALEPATIVTGKEMPSYFIDGTLAVYTDVTASFVAQRYMKLHSILIHCKDKGSADTTIVDAHLNGTTIFTDQDKRPMLDWDATEDYAISDTPDVIELAPGDVLTFDIDEIAMDVSGLTITPFERVVELVTIEDDIATVQVEMT